MENRRCRDSLVALVGIANDWVVRDRLAVLIHDPNYASGAVSSVEVQLKVTRVTVARQCRGRGQRGGAEDITGGGREHTRIPDRAQSWVGGLLVKVLVCHEAHAGGDGEHH